MPATKEKTYSEAEITERLKELPGWYYEDGWIRRVYKTDGWPTTLMLVNAVAYLAEAAYHHPDLTVTWGRIIVKLQNHAAGGITRQGFRAGPEDRGGRALAAPGRRARGNPEQVGPVGGSTVEPERRRVLFVTGKLAEPALREVLREMDPPFEARVAVLKITVAALMTTQLDRPVPRSPRGHRPRPHPGPVRGRSRRDPGAGRGAGREGAQGPPGDSPLLRSGGRARRSTARTPSRSSPRSTTPRGSAREAVRAAADYFRASGADLIDIGCTPGLAYPDLGAVVRELREAGMRVSVDSFDPDEIRTAVEAGAELVLSVNRSNLAVARELGGHAGPGGGDPRPRRGPRQPGAQHLGARGLGSRLSDRSRSSSRSASASWPRSSATPRCAAAIPTPRS